MASRGSPQSSDRLSSTALAAAGPRIVGGEPTVQATAPVAWPSNARVRTSDSSAHFWYASGNAERCTRWAASVIRIRSQPLTLFSAA